MDALRFNIGGTAAKIAKPLPIKFPEEAEI
jgi:hypothetical protein